MRQQIDNLRQAFGDDLRINVVVGFKLHLIIEANPDVSFVYNEAYDVTNTSASLRKALMMTQDVGILWLNGDVVFDPHLLEDLKEMLEGQGSFVCVNTASVAEEEVKYDLDGSGFVKHLSKSVSEGLGEAVGINYVSPEDKPAVIDGLRACADQDYFERGLEIAIERGQLRLTAVDISEFGCVEVDVQSDLDVANSLVW